MYSWKLAGLLIVALISVLSGCATIVDSGPDQVTVNSQPSGASIYVDGALVGTTPSSIALDRSSTGTIRIEKKGYEPITVRKMKSLNGWLIGNLCFGGIPGLVVDVVTDNHEKFDANPVMVNLTPVDSAGNAGQPVSLRLEPIKDDSTR